MSKTKQLLNIVWRQPAKFRLPQAMPILLHKKNRLPGRHAKKILISLSSRHELAISLRKFKTKKITRSKRKQQLVIPVFLMSVKEISVSYRHYKKPRKMGTFYTSRYNTQVASLLLVTMGVAGTLFFGSNISASNKSIPAPTRPTVAVQNILAAPKPINVLNRSEPTRLNIPSVGIDSDLRAVGRNADQSLEVPGSPWQAGWYSEAPTPGELGPAIIVGHVDSLEGPAIFWRLAELKPGDIVEVSRADNSIAKFRVDEVTQFPQESFPTERVYNNLDYAGIRLITCGGVFNTQTGHYSHNTVVFGTLVTPEL